MSELNLAPELVDRMRADPDALVDKEFERMLGTAKLRQRAAERRKKDTAERTKKPPEKKQPPKDES